MTGIGPVGFIGLGAMGSQLSHRTLTSGVPVIGYDPDPEPMLTLAGLGGSVAESVEEAASRCTWIVTSLPNAAALHSVAAQVVTARDRESLCGVIETSTLSVEDKEEVAATLESAELGMVDSPLSGTSQQASTGDLIAYVSGSARDCESALPVLRTFTRAQYSLGRLGNGTRMKLVANHLVAIHNVAAAEALLVAARAGLDLPTVLEAVGDGAGSSRMLQVRGPMMARGDYVATMRIDNFVKDLDIISQYAERLRSPIPLLDECAKRYRTMLASGLGDQDTAAVYADLEREAAHPSEQADQA